MKVTRYIMDVLQVWADEMRNIFKDEGLLLFLVVLPFVYPMLYSWIYNNEVAREIPVVIVDKSHSAESREFIRMYDASPNVRVACYANNLQEAKDIVGHQEAYGVLYFPSDFSTTLNRMEQATVGVYCDMQLMLAYKAIYQTAVTIQTDINSNIQTKLLGNYTDREDEISTSPLQSLDVSIFNTTIGYGNFILPGVLMLIIQQVILLGMGMTAGTSRDKYGTFLPKTNGGKSAGRLLCGKWLAYMMLFLINSSFILLIVPKIFAFVSIIYAKDLLLMVIPYLCACIFFAMSTMTVIRQREDVMIIVVFTSIILLFMAGISWPGSAIPAVWRYFSYLFPSTFGINAFVRMNSMGGRLEDVQPEIIALWIHAVVYGIIAWILYWREIKKTRNNI